MPEIDLDALQAGFAELLETLEREGLTEIDLDALQEYLQECPSPPELDLAALQERQGMAILTLADLQAGIAESIAVLEAQAQNPAFPRRVRLRSAAQAERRRQILRRFTGKQRNTTESDG